MIVVFGVANVCGFRGLFGCVKLEAGFSLVCLMR